MVLDEPSLATHVPACPRRGVPLIDRGIDMTIRDYRWNSTAEGWARYGANNPTMGDWLADAERRRT